jgi:M6 family metalloprotease-like protein
MSYPFYDKEFTFTQPDGTEIMVKGWGDQHHAVFESLDGYSIVLDPESGFYCYADLSDDEEDLVSTGVKVGVVDAENLGLRKGLRIKRDAARQEAFAAYSFMGAKRRCEVRRERARSLLHQAMMHGGPLMAPPARETTGSFTGLCLLIQFPDVDGAIAREKIENFCNQPGYNGYGNNGSVYDYFSDNSNGLLHYTNIVTPYYTAKHPRSYYTNPAISYGKRARELVKEGLAYLETQGFDFGQLTVDDEGYVYAVNVFYAGHCPNNWGKGLWPHSWSLAMPYVLAPDVKAFDYQITDMGSELTLATFCHENGHMICDYPDLYDYGYESRGTGVYCLMCSGGSNDKNPTQICAYLKYKSGWAKKLTTISGNMQAQISAKENDFFIYRKNLAEYFVIENRYCSGRDQELPSSGLAIWHVDELGSNNNEQMTPTNHYECSLEQADNQFDLEKGQNYGDADDLFSATTGSKFSDSTTPDSKWWDGTDSGLVLSNIDESETVMSFDIGYFEEEATQAYHKSSTPQIDIPDSDSEGVRDVIHFAEDAAITTVKVTVDITHTYRGDLKVTLTAPSGTSVVLHERGGGRADNLTKIFDFGSTHELRELIGQSLQGDWTIHVQDLAPADQGRFNRWELEIQGTTDKMVELEEYPGVDIPDEDPSGIERILETDASGTVMNITVSVDITHTYIGDLIVVLEAPSGMLVDLHRRTGGRTDNLITTYNLVTTPGLQNLSGETIKGKWQLKVADVAGQDLGKLNHWRLKITRQS